MLENIDLDSNYKRYEVEGGKYILLAINKYGKDEVGDDIRIKIPHGLSMSKSVEDISMNSGMFNSSFKNSGALDGLLHDIGRFEQYLESGTLDDYTSSLKTGYADHGQYGRYILNRDKGALLKEYIPDTRLYDYVLSEVVGEHTQIKNSKYKISLEKLKSIFQNYSLEEILKSNDEDVINKLIALKLLIVIEADSLELIQKVRDGLWKPALGFENKYYVHDDIWSDFVDFRFINMKKFKEEEIWTCNAGFLLRFSLLFRNINLVGTLKSILEDGTLDKVFEMQSNNVTDDNNNFIIDKKMHDPRLKDAYEYTKLAIENLIKNSKDGITITLEDREIAKEQTKRNFGIK